MNGALAGHPLRWAVPPAAHALRSRALPPSPRLHPPLHTHSQSPPLPAPSTPPSASRPCALPAGPGGAPLDGHVDAALHHAVEGDLYVPHLPAPRRAASFPRLFRFCAEFPISNAPAARSTGRTCPRHGAPPVAPMRRVRPRGHTLAIQSAIDAIEPQALLSPNVARRSDERRVRPTRTHSLLQMPEGRRHLCGPSRSAPPTPPSAAREIGRAGRRFSTPALGPASRP